MLISGCAEYDGDPGIDARHVATDSTSEAKNTTLTGWRVVRTTWNGDGYVLYGDNTFQWLSAACLSTLSSQGVAIDKVNWDDIKWQEHLSGTGDCAAVGAAVSGHNNSNDGNHWSVVTTNANGYGYVRLGDGTWQWLSAACISNLRINGVPTTRVKWPEVQWLTQVENRVSCSDIRAALGSTSGASSSTASSSGTNNSVTVANTRSGKPRVVILTDINNNAGDPDDKQSLTHILWYADELDIRQIVPDKWSNGNFDATYAAINAYESDYWAHGFAAIGFAHPADIRSRVSQNETSAVSAIVREADASDQPLHVLVWGSMKTLARALRENPDIASKLRVHSIATGRFYGWNCSATNYNAGGRNEIYNDSRFNQMWWIENNWTYNGMFDGNRPRQVFNQMLGYGAMGWHMQTAVSGESWAAYFRAGDTPSVLYLIDPSNNLDNPEQGSWAGQFTRPFPSQRPNYYTDSAGGEWWDFQEPCNSWHRRAQVYANNTATLLARRESMYASLFEKLNRIYNR